MKYDRPVGLAVILLLCLILCGCNRQNADTSGQAVPDSIHYEAGQTNVLVPDTVQTDPLQNGPLSLDFTHADLGYFTGVLSDDIKVNIQLTGPDQVVYKYFLEKPGELTVFPFTAGSGPYLVLAFENVGADQYSALFSYSLDVNLQNDFLPFLFPNQYVSFSADSEAVKLAAELTADADTDLKALEAVYKYVTENIVYDDEKAATVESGYLPDIDETLRTGRGICFDYAALTASMLRSLSIPTRLAIGYSSDVRHAWIDVYIESMGWVENAIEFNGEHWALMDPTFAAAAGGEDAINDYIGDGDNYLVQYIR